MKKKVKLIIVITVLILSLLLLAFSYYSYQLLPVSNDKQVVEIVIPKGATGNSIARVLKEKNLIKDANIFKLYLKLHHVSNINYGTYELTKAMGVKVIVSTISEGKAKNNDIKVLFQEGINMRKIAKIIATNTNNTENDVFNLLKDKTYIDSLIGEYWFLTAEIKDSKIYYSLEGYLAPNTYNFVSKDVTVKEIFKVMLDQTASILNPYRATIGSKNFTIHQFMTLASIVESEGVSDDDRPKIASVFYNRLDDGMAFQSCATACYAAKFDGACVPNNVNTSYNSPYNTYLPSMIGLPVGPISNPGVASIRAALEPADTDNLYFLADKNKETYFFKSYAEHQAKKQQLIQAGLWYE